MRLLKGFAKVKVLGAKNKKCFDVFQPACCGL